MNATSKEKNLASRRRAQSQSLRTTADIACIGVHPSAVEALQQYKKALKIYETNNVRGGSVGNNNSGRHNPSSPLPPKISSPSPFYRAASPTNNQIAAENKQQQQQQQQQQQHDAALPAQPDPYYSISAVKNRLLLDIAADYVCETAFRQLFVDHKKYALFVEGEVNDHEPNISEASNSSSPLHPPPCRPFVKGPKMIKRKNGTEAKEPVTVNLENPAVDLVIDDMLWVVDNRKAPSAHVRSLTAWQDNYESNTTTAPLGVPPACTDSAGSAEQDDNNSNENTAASAQAQSPPKGSNLSAVPQKGSKGAQTLAYYANVIPTKYPLLPSTVCVSKAQQIQLHRRNVLLTREYFATAAAAESEYRVAVQDLGIPPHPSHALMSPSNSFVHSGNLSPTTSFASPVRNAPAGGGGALSPYSPSMPAYAMHSPPQAVQLSYPLAAVNSKENTAGKEKGFGKFIKALSKVMDGDKEKEKEEGDAKNIKSSSGGGEDANSKEKVSDVLAASASSLAATIGRLTGGKFSTGSTGGFSDNPRANRVGSGHLISELVGLPPISWRETLAVNIITQWTYTLTIAVAKLVTSTVNVLPATPVSSSSAVPVNPPTTATAMTKKELVVMRHISKRVYAQPTKAMFHTKEHRGESGDTMDYPNVYFNIDDFEDEDLFRDIKLSEGFTFAVLLTAGATHNSNATIFRGALSYDVVMERIKREEMRSEGKSLPITPAHPSFSNNGSFGYNGGVGGGNSSSRSLESKALANSKDKYSGQSNDSQQASKLFIPLVGPERKGKAELAVSISETEIMLSHMSSQNTSFCGDQSHQAFGRDEEERRSSASRMNSALFKDEEAGGYTTHSGGKGSSDKEKDSSGIFGRLMNKVKSKVESGGNSGGNITKDSGDGYLSPSRSLLDERTSHSTMKSGGAYKSKLNGGEAIQCCLTFVSVHAQHVLDVLLSNDLEKNQQWLSYYESDELTKALSGNLNS